MHELDKTITAICTNPGPGGISVIRISGPEALKIASKIFKCKAPPLDKRPAQSFVYGKIYDFQGKFIDEAIALIFRAPHSYTKQDVVEIQCHGGKIIAERILEIILEVGAFTAFPGEFTYRAFINGRIDLTQAESVVDLVNSTSKRAAAVAAMNLKGDLSLAITEIYNSIITALAHIEALLEFPEEDIPQNPLESLKSIIESNINRINNLLLTYSQRCILKEGLRVVIAGPVNAGKSTLFNSLLGKPRAIVTPLPGTTRDTIEESIIMENIMVVLIDTAGIRQTSCEIEKEGIKRTNEEIEKSDLCIYVIDSSEQPSEEAVKILYKLPADKTLIVLNKIDKGEVYVNLPETFYVIKSSFVHKKGIDLINGWLSKKIKQLIPPEPQAVINERHRDHLRKALETLQEAKELTFCGEEYTLPVIQLLKESTKEIGAILGKNIEPDILEKIFSSFCIGK